MVRHQESNPGPTDYKAPAHNNEIKDLGRILVTHAYPETLCFQGVACACYACGRGGLGVGGVDQGQAQIVDVEHSLVAVAAGFLLIGPGSTRIGDTPAL